MHINQCISINAQLMCINQYTTVNAQH